MVIYAVVLVIASIGELFLVALFTIISVSKTITRQIRTEKPISPSSQPMTHENVVTLSTECLKKLSITEKQSLDDKMGDYNRHTSEPVVLLEDIPVEDLEPMEPNKWKVKHESKTCGIVVYINHKYGAEVFAIQKKGPNNFDQEGKRRPEGHFLFALPKRELENLVERMKAMANMDVALLIKNSNLKPE